MTKFSACEKKLSFFSELKQNCCRLFLNCSKSGVRLLLCEDQNNVINEIVKFFCQSRCDQPVMS